MNAHIVLNRQAIETNCLNLHKKWTKEVGQNEDRRETMDEDKTNVKEWKKGMEKSIKDQRGTEGWIQLTQFAICEKYPNV
jgi:hypothetical protein